MFIDTHCHLDWESYQEDLDQVIDNARRAGVEKFVTIGVDVPRNRRAAEIVKKHSDIYRCVGFHPEIVSEEEFSEVKINILMKELETLLAGERVVGIGECGLDYYHLQDRKLQNEEMLRIIELQKDLFERQILIALRKGLPLSLHVRDHGEDAYFDTISILSEYYSENVGAKELMFSITDLSKRFEEDATDAQVVGKEAAVHSVPKGVLHCVSGPADYILSAIDLGFMIGICGNITYKNAQPLRDVVKEIALEHMVLETDAPFLAPANHRGKRNESAMMVETALCLADLKGVTLEAIEKVTTENANRLFNIQ